jgi:hypothetical protein
LAGDAGDQCHFGGDLVIHCVSSCNDYVCKESISTPLKGIMLPFGFVLA